MKKLLTYFILCICFVAIGFGLGRCTQTKPKTVYVKGETIHDSILVEVPVKEYIPSKPQWLTKRDTLWKDSIVYVREAIDTAAILADWIIKRRYENVLFDVDTLGRLVVNSTIQYNTLQSLSYDFTPVRKEITRIKQPTFEPFVMIGLQSEWTPSLQAGLFYKHFGIAYDFSVWKQNGQTEKIHGLKVGWKF